jgi:1,4-dihydroxy-2-naphthoate octaprenyltransferase
MRNLKDWVIATRPWSFPASFIPVLAIGAFLTDYNSRNGGGPVDWGLLLLAVVMMVVFQAAGNLISDYYDHVRGVDPAGSLNQVRAIQSGKFTPKELLFYGYCVLAAGAMIGVILLFLTSWKLIWLGTAAIVSIVFYMWLKAHALSGLTILFCFSILPAIGASYVGTGSLVPLVIPVSLPFGLLIVAILHANNTRDIRSDRQAGVLTFAVSIGDRASKWIYAAEVATSYLLVLIFALVDWTPWWSLLTWLTVPLAWPLVKTMLSARPEDGIAIATIDQKTAGLQLAFGLLYTISFFLALI